MSGHHMRICIAAHALAAAIEAGDIDEIDRQQRKLQLLIDPHHVALPRAV